MKGFPNTIQTGQDLNNCLALVQQGEVSGERLKLELGRIERLRYIYVPIEKTVGNKVTIRYCNEVEIGMMINGGKVSAIEVLKGEDNQPTDTVITFEKELSVETFELRIPNPVDIYNEMGITQKQIADAWEVLNRE